MHAYNFILACFCLTLFQQKFMIFFLKRAELLKCGSNVELLFVELLFVTNVELK